MKLNESFKKWPPNTLATSSWLEKVAKMTRQDIDYYVEKEYLTKVGNGCFKRSGEEVDWSGAIYTLQKNSNLNLHLSGYSALKLEGVEHNLSFGSVETVELWGAPRTTLPSWVKSLDPSFRFKLKSSKIFDPSKFGLKEHRFRGNYNITVSTLERASLEVLCDIKGPHSFEEAVNSISTILTINSEEMNKALLACNSFKARRIFFFILNYCDLRLIGNLNMKDYDLGKGNLSISKGGYYVNSLKLTVPAEFKPQTGSHF